MAAETSIEWTETEFAFRTAFRGRYSPEVWAANPWVWAITFEVQK